MWQQQNFVNGNTYIPTELIYQPPKKAGAALFITRKPAAATSTSSIKTAGKVSFRQYPQWAEVDFNKISGPRNKNYPGLISMLQGFQKCIA